VVTQPHTGYDEQDFDFKLRFALSGVTDLVAAFQSVEVDDAWRTHRTIFGRSWRGTTVGNELRRSLDQRRSLGYLQLHHRSSGGFFDAMAASLSWQRQEEERDRPRSNEIETPSPDLDPDLFDEEYRIHGSGLNEPGRNFLASAQIRF